MLKPLPAPRCGRNCATRFFQLFLCIIPNFLLAQPGIEWDKTFAGNKHDFASVVIQTSDGGYLTGGHSLSDISGDKSQAKRGGNVDAYDFWVVKMNSAGTKQWDKTIGGDGLEYLSAMLQTSDGGYLLGGISRSDISGEKTANHIGSASAETNKTDFWIVKLAADGTKQWDKTIGGGLEDSFSCMAATADGGYILGGSSNSLAGANKTEAPKGGLDYWIVKIASNGNVQWDKTIGGNQNDLLKSVVQTQDGGYALGGTSLSGADGDKTAASRGNVDYWIVKLSSSGTPQWDKTIGGNNSDNLSSLHLTADGGYIAGGTSLSDISGDKSEAGKGKEDYWVVKLAQNGIVQWQKTLGTAYNERLDAVQQVNDGGYIVSGSSNSDINGDKTVGNAGASDCWLVKLSSTGAKSWDTAVGSNYYDELVALRQTSDGGFILAGSSNSSAGFAKTEGIKFTFFENDYWVVKLVSESNSNKLSFSTGLLDFTNITSGPIPPQSSTLSSNNGTPPIVLSKSSPTPWLNLPPAAFGPMSFSIDKTFFNNPGYAYSSVVTAVSPGYARAALFVRVFNSDLFLSPIGNKTAVKNSTLTFTAGADFWPAVDPKPAKIFSLVNAPTGASIDASTGAFRWTPAIAGSYTFKVRVTSGDAMDEEEISVLVPEQPLNSQIRINAGGPYFGSGPGAFMSDRYFFGDERTSSVSSGDILNTSDDELYRSGRCSPAFNYAIPMSNGTYDVILHFAEVWFGARGRGPGGAGSRMFNVDIEGKRKLTNYDIFVAARGAMRAVQEKFTVTVTDQLLNLDFMSGAADLPRLAAIEVLPHTETVTLEPVADAYVRAGTYAPENFGAAASLEVKNGIDPRIKRLSFLKFSLAGLSQISSAKLRVFGYNYEDNNPVRILARGIYEDNWTEGGITWYNGPTFPNLNQSEVYVNATQKYYEFDVTSFIGYQVDEDKVATILLQNYNTQNRRVIFNSRESISNRPQLVIETTGSVTNGARMTAEISETNLETGSAKSTIYPNPARKQFTVLISDQHKGDVSLELMTTAGRTYALEPKERIYAGSKAKIDISNFALEAGIYLLNVKSATSSETLKMMLID